MKTFEKLRMEELSPDLHNLIKDCFISEYQVQIALYIWFSQEDIIKKTLWIKLLTELIDNTLTPSSFISINDLRLIVLEADWDLYKIKIKLNSIIDIAKLSNEWIVLVMSILDIQN